MLCLEGASAVGKTNTSYALAERLKAVVVSEVNALFERPSVAPDDWYLNRQVERWSIAHHALGTHPLVVLDGDPFQPLWYNWSFGFQNWQSLDELRAFYRPLLVSGELNFPDRYILLVIGKDELRRRKERDGTRSRRGFEDHLCLADTLPCYFSAMSSLDPLRVGTIEAVSLAGNVRHIEASLRTWSDGLTDPLFLFDGLVDWLGSHTVEEQTAHDSDDDVAARIP
jgi:hypothetical protein